MSYEPENDLHYELVVGLVGAVGAELKLVIGELENQLRQAGYETRVIKVSEHVIKSLKEVPDDEGDRYRRISDLMDAGDTIRKEAKENGVLALGVATEIFAERDKDAHDYPRPLKKTAFIVDSLKRPEEVEFLRRIYPFGFVLVGTHEEENRRLGNLQNQGIDAENAQRLVGRDGEEAKVPHGQRLNKTFHLADFFVRITDVHVYWFSVTLSFGVLDLSLWARSEGSREEKRGGVRPPGLASGPGSALGSVPTVALSSVQVFSV